MAGPKTRSGEPPEVFWMCFILLHENVFNKHIFKWEEPSSWMVTAMTSRT